ncbi:hypothetical protein XELAEV_18025017mg [Xenopus laevis]|uniref:Uncharacterized protein n=1 Tax=Xenopus laevis TaxID=8355 RepID=A0A974HLY7_XENLA|nr:hypothetical protein XELAEV_18025017mg [Xenopus laevis]
MTWMTENCHSQNTNIFCSALQRCYIIPIRPCSGRVYSGSLVLIDTSNHFFRLYCTSLNIYAIGKVKWI